ncbi:MAG: hypothetical protein LBG66_05105, partial [Gallionellaceae bacterium]|nr:hypothetical protein [Gallionellaceae bacterium]
MTSALLKSDAVKSAASIAALLLGMANAHADPAPQDSRNGLQALAFAAHQTNYSGTFVYQHGNRVEVSNIAHLVDSTGEYSRLDRLDGPPRTIIRKNDEVWCYLGNREVRVALRHGGRTFPALLPEQLSLLNENYQIRQGEASRVAGFPVHALIFQPRDALRYVHKMWAHDDSGLLLQAAVLDERGNLIEQYTFTQLTIGGNIDRNWITAPPPHSSVNGALNATSPAEKAPPVQAAAVPAASEPESITSGWLVDVPPGFKKIAEV